jgi:hypothetical protein
LSSIPSTTKKKKKRQRRYSYFHIPMEEERMEDRLVWTPVARKVGRLLWKQSLPIFGYFAD